MRLGLRRLTAIAGGACLTVSAFCLASDTTLRAAPLLAVRLHLPFSSPRAAVQAPAPAASGTPAPQPERRAWLGRGPLVFRGDGTYQLALNRSSRNGLSSTTDNYSTALSMVAERRTEQSALSVSSAFGYGAGTISAGSLIVGYRTPRYALTYGQVTGPSDSQLQIGGFARGLSLAVPLRNGDVSFLTSTAQQADRTTYRVFGVRRNWNALGGFLSLGEYFAAGEQGVGHQSITDVGYRRYGAKLSTDAEVAVSSTRAVGGVADGANLAGAFHADLQGKSTFTTLGVRYDPAGFQTLTGAVDPGMSADLSVRRHSDRFGEVDLTLGHTDDRLAGVTQHDNRVTLSGGRTWNGFGVQYVGGLDAGHSQAGWSLQRTGALTFTESVRGLSLFETYQATGTSASTGGAAQRQIALGLSRSVFGGVAAYQFAHSNSGGGESSTGAGSSHALSFRRSLGRKLDAQFTQTLQTASNNGVETKLVETTVSLVRRLSTVVAVQVGIDHFHQIGVGGGSGTAINASLVGPFGFGQRLQGGGRANPNLPAVIRGIVTYSTSPSPFAYNASAMRGFNNALVILDGRLTQRTDANGEFEFRFVTAGTHTIRIDPATVPPGLITDREYQTLSVLGGQTSTVQFAVGNFAGVGGSVWATDSAGRKRGLGEVGIAVDGIQAVRTTPDGHYSIGRLSPGAHTVEVVEATLPSNVAFTADRKKTVTVTAGTATPLDFTATPLGAIGGTVMAASDAGFGNLAGLKNVYVIAQPGEHAAITDDDGGFLLDNLPPGTYTLSVDPDTIPEGLSLVSGPEGPLPLSGGATLSGVAFKLGPGAKQVVYTFSDGRRQAIQVSTDPETAPPGAVLHILARSPAKDLKEMVVESDVFGNLPLHLDAKAGGWAGTLVVPPLAKGDYALTVTAHRSDVAAGSALVPIDPRLPLFTVRYAPRSPEAGHTMRVMLKALAPVEEGDAVLFEDGYKLALPRPTGRIFTFDMRLWRKGLPYSGSVVTKRGHTYPLSLR